VIMESWSDLVSIFSFGLVNRRAAFVCEKKPSNRFYRKDGPKFRTI